MPTDTAAAVERLRREAEALRARVAALEEEDFPTLCRLLDEGRRIKEEVDGK